jgi:hypothetical protein
MRARWTFAAAPRRSLFTAGLAVALAIVAGTTPARAVHYCLSAIPAGMVDKVDSSSARAGGTFTFKITENEQLDDGTPIPAGTPGYGLIRYAAPAGRGHDGVLALEPRYVVVRKPQGGYRRIDVTMNPTIPAQWTARDLVGTAISNAPIPIPGVSIALNAMHFGRNITLGPGFTFSVIPIDNLQKGPIC